MRIRFRSPVAKVFAIGLAIAATSVKAADHLDPGGMDSDAATDLTDFYAWHTDDTFVAVITFAGLVAAGTDPVFDDGVLYTVHIDRDGDGVSELDIHTRFGTNEDDEWGVQVESLPGAEGLVVGPVGEVLESGERVRVFAGPREDPFFFDFDGYGNTLATETVAFDPTNDTFAGTNVTAIVLEMDLAEAADGSDNLQVWASTARKEG